MAPLRPQWRKALHLLAGLLLAAAGLANPGTEAGTGSEGTPPARVAHVPPVEAYASLPAVAGVRLSPDGSKLVMLRALHGAMHAFVVDLASGAVNPVLAADTSRFYLNGCRWANDTRLLCSIRSYGTLKSGQPGIFYRDGRITFTRLIAVDADGGNRLQLVPEPVNSVGRELRWNPPDQDNLVSLLPDDPEHVLISLARDHRLRPGVYRLNIYTNKLTRVRRHHELVYAWYADRSGTIRFGVGYDDLTPVAFSVQDTRARRLDISHFEGIAEPNVLGLSADGSRAWVGSYYGGRTYAYHAVNTATGQVERTLLADEDYDLFGGGLHLDAATWNPILAEYWREAPVRHWFDPDLAARMQPAYDALHTHHGVVQTVQISRSGQQAVFLASGRGTAPTWYVFDAPSEQLKRLAVTYPDLERIPEPEILRFEARDGLPLTAYLTRPDGEGPFPTIVFPHGGPNSRDYPGFNYWTQFLVSRGYAVIQPNFRGSIGYGAAHLEAGFNQWGLAMQDDVMDTLDHVVDLGIADPARVCFVGASYGGYVALVAAFKTPERLRCAVSFAGVTDLVSLRERLRYFDLGELSLARIQGGRAMRENSPLHQVARFAVPVLVVHGDADRSVMVDQSRDLARALEKAGKPHTYIELADGDHFLSNEAHRLRFFGELEDFLRLHLDRPAHPERTNAAAESASGR